MWLGFSGEIGEGDDGAFVFSLGGAVGQDAQLKGVALAGSNFSFDDLSVADYLHDQLLEVGDLDHGVNVQEGSSHVRRDQAQSFLGQWSEAANGAVGSEHDDGQVEA